MVTASITSSTHKLYNSQYALRKQTNNSLAEGSTFPAAPKDRRGGARVWVFNVDEPMQSPSVHTWYIPRYIVLLVSSSSSNRRLCPSDVMHACGCALCKNSTAPCQVVLQRGRHRRRRRRTRGDGRWSSVLLEQHPQNHRLLFLLSFYLSPWTHCFLSVQKLFSPSTCAVRLRPFCPAPGPSPNFPFSCAGSW